MKTSIKIFTLSLLTIFVLGCKGEQQPELKEVASEKVEVKKELDPNATYAKAEFNIEGMSCAVGCAAKIEKKLAKMDGVKSAKVDFENEMAMVEYDVDKVDHNSIESTVTKVGATYTVKNMKSVDAFGAKKACADDCEKDCCKNKTEAEKKACSEECKKKCCASKA